MKSSKIEAAALDQLRQFINQEIGGKGVGDRSKSGQLATWAMIYGAVSIWGIRPSLVDSVIGRSKRFTALHPKFLEPGSDVIFFSVRSFCGTMLEQLTPR